MQHDNSVLAGGVIVCGIAVIACIITGIMTFHFGEQTGAKIALSDTEYRMDEVRGDCEYLFAPAECVKCHNIDFAQ